MNACFQECEKRLMIKCQVEHLETVSEPKSCLSSGIGLKGSFEILDEGLWTEKIVPQLGNQPPFHREMSVWISSKHNVQTQKHYTSEFIVPVSSIRSLPNDMWTVTLLLRRAAEAVEDALHIL